MSEAALLERPATGTSGAGLPSTPELERRSFVGSLADRFPYLLDVRTGLVLFVAFAAFAVSPLGRHVDRATYLRPLRPGMPGFGLVRDGLDHIASQGGEGVAMGLVALATTLLMRSSLPLLVAGATEGLFYLTGLVKLGFAKDAPRFGTPSYWAGGYVDHGKYGMAFPSGHTAEVVLVFGASVLLLHLAFPGWSAAHARRVKTVWLAVGLDAAVVSWALGTHWLTDLVGGAIFGGVMLRVLVASVDRGHLPALAARIDGIVAAGARRVRRA